MGHLTLIAEGVLITLEWYPPDLRETLIKYAPEWEECVKGRYVNAPCLRALHCRCLYPPWHLDIGCCLCKDHGSKLHDGGYRNRCPPQGQKCVTHYEPPRLIDCMLQWSSWLHCRWSVQDVKESIDSYFQCENTFLRVPFGYHSPVMDNLVMKANQTPLHFLTCICIWYTSTSHC